MVEHIEGEPWVHIQPSSSWQELEQPSLPMIRMNKKCVARVRVAVITGLEARSHRISTITADGGRSDANPACFNATRRGCRRRELIKYSRHTASITRLSVLIITTFWWFNFSVPAGYALGQSKKYKHQQDWCDCSRGCHFCTNMSRHNETKHLNKFWKWKCKECWLSWVGIERWNSSGNNVQGTEQNGTKRNIFSSWIGWSFSLCSY